MNFASGITQHTVVVLSEKRDRGKMIEMILKKTGFKVISTFSLYEGLRYISQEMPHLIVTESLLSDGTAGTLYDRLQHHDTLKNTPILVNVIAKNQKELAPLAGRNFAGVFLGALDPKAFYQKVREIIGTHSQVSPFFVSAEEGGFAKEFDILIDAELVGCLRDQVVGRSIVKLDSAASFVCRSKAPGKEPAILGRPNNLEIKGETFNLFPSHRISGKGRKWVTELPDVLNPDGGKPIQMPQNRKILMVHDKPEHVKQWIDILKGFDIEVVDGGDLVTAGRTVVSKPTEYGAIYIHDFESEAQRRTWHNVYCQIDPKIKPPVVVGIQSKKLTSNTDYIALKRPFGLGRFIEIFEAAFERADAIAQVAGKNSPNPLHGYPVHLAAEAELLGLDEVGGVIETKFPMLVGSRFGVGHSFLGSAWQGGKAVLVSHIAQSPDNPEAFQIRFEAVEAGTSKVKYWEKMQIALAGIKPAPVEHDQDLDQEITEPDLEDLDSEEDEYEEEYEEEFEVEVAESDDGSEVDDEADVDIADPDLDMEFEDALEDDDEDLESDFDEEIEDAS